MSAYIASRELNFRQALGLKDNLAKGYNTIQYTDEIEQLPKDNLGNVFADSSIRLTESERAEGLKWITNDCGIVVEEANVYFYYGDFKIISDDHCEMNVYEWNSFTWKDIDSTIIESGFGTWHYLSLEKLGEGKLLVRDEYDEIGISNVDTVSLEKREILENQKNLDTHNLHEDHLPLTTTSILPANVTYNPFAAISYANSYVNPDTTINNTSQKF